MLLFGTDSLDYVAMWLGAVRIGIVPAVVSDLYKARDLLYFLRDTAARLLFIDAEQLGKLIEIAGELPASLQTIILRGEHSLGVAPQVRPAAPWCRCEFINRVRIAAPVPPLPAPPQRRRLHVLFRRHHRHRQGHHPSRP